MKKYIFSLIISVLTLSFLSACNVQVKFKLNFIVDGKVYHTLDTDNEISLPDDPEKPGFEFAGWFWDKDVWEDSFTVNSFLNTPLSKDMAVYAHWTADSQTTTTFPVILNANGGSVESGLSNLTVGTEFTLPVPVLAGHSFDGWYTEIDEGTKVTDSSGGGLAVWVINENTTLYAR